MSDDLPLPSAVLPHRAPFLFVDRVLSCDGEVAVAERFFGADEPFFAGHFPGNPVVPGVILVEGLAQTLAYLALRQTGGGTVLLTGMSVDKIRRPVRPGETVRYTVRVSRARRQMVMAEGEVVVGDERVLVASLKGFVAVGGA
jgi:3-hydroxyacyl-[acyl-carrier-protein] dehydratase